jgi:8-oxo-dGTP pyrophosphatase MutT (NUDIX family)
VPCQKRDAAYAVIRSGDGRVAVVREDRRWFLPGGGSLAGETPEQTVAREVLEECGRRARGLQRIGDAIQYFYAPIPCLPRVGREPRMKMRWRAYAARRFSST